MESKFEKIEPILDAVFFAFFGAAVLFTLAYITFK